MCGDLKLAIDTGNIGMAIATMQAKIDLYNSAAASFRSEYADMPDLKLDIELDVVKTESVVRLKYRIAAVPVTLVGVPERAAAAVATPPERRKVDVIQVSGFPDITLSSAVYLSVDCFGSIDGLMGACRHCGQVRVVVPYSEWKGTVLVVIDGKMDVPDFLECEACKRKETPGRSPVPRP